MSPTKLSLTFETMETRMNVPYQIPGRAPDEDRSQNISTYWRERFTEEPYYTEGDRFEAVRQRAMRLDYSIERQARILERVYREANRARAEAKDAAATVAATE